MTLHLYEIASLGNPIVDATAYTKEQNARCAECQSKLGAAVAGECGQRIVIALDVHSLNYLEIIV